MFGMQFLSISKQKLCLYFSRVWRVKKSFWSYILNPLKNIYFVVDTLEKNKHNFCFKIDKNCIQNIINLNRSNFKVFDRFEQEKKKKKKGYLAHNRVFPPIHGVRHINCHFSCFTTRFIAEISLFHKTIRKKKKKKGYLAHNRVFPL